MNYEHDFDRALELGERSLALLKQVKTAPLPPHYELFYVFASGVNKELNEAVRRALADKNHLTSPEATELCETYLSPSRANEQIDEVGDQLNSEIGQILEHLNEATDCTHAFGESLKKVLGQLDQISDPKQAGMVVQKIIEATTRMTTNTQQLERRLEDSKGQISELKDNLEAVRKESLTDPLTGVANRKQFDHVLKDAIEDARESGHPVCLLMVDIDHFKRFNDTFGHQAGDGVLKLVAKAMQGSVKGRDLVARYGGEEFGIILPATTIDNALIVAEQIRQLVMGKELIKKSTNENLGNVTLSIGVAVLNSGDTPESMIQRADSCLYAAKHAGRNQVKSELDQEQVVAAEPSAA